MTKCQMEVSYTELVSCLEPVTVTPKVEQLIARERARVLLDRPGTIFVDVSASMGVHGH